MRVWVVALGVGVLAAGCGSQTAAPSKMKESAAPMSVKAACAPGSLERLGNGRFTYAAVAKHALPAYRSPRGKIAYRFGRRNANRFPTVFAVLEARLTKSCRRMWLRVRLPAKPNGATGWVRASAVDLVRITTRIDVDLSARRVVLYVRGRRRLATTAAVGAPGTPTPRGHYYVNQRLIPTDTSGPFGPGAIGISAFSDVLTGWTQGGPIAIHGTDEPWLLGRSVSHGCIRVRNAVLRRLFRLVPAGTPVSVHA